MRRMGLFKRFRREEKASVGLIFGLSLLPLMGMVGGAVDYARGSMARLDLQSAVDVTALALAKDATNMPIAQAEARAQTIFLANWNNRFAASLTSLSIARTTSTYTVTARVRLANVIMPLFGVSDTEVGTVGISGWGVNRIEIALVLDNTGSMGWSNKMEELKKALCGDQTCSSDNPTSGFVRSMRDAAREDDQIRIALVPFDTTVRVPLSYQQQVLGGTRVNDAFSYTGSGYCSTGFTTNDARRIRINGGVQPDFFSIVRFANRDKDTVSNNRDNAGNNLGTGCGTRTSSPPVRLDFNNWQTWQGCLWDRDQDGNRDIGPLGVDVGNINTLYPAVTCRSNNLARMMPLVDVRTNTTQLVTALRSMQPSGNTNLTIGTSWGTNMLVPGAPLSTAAAPDPQRPLRRFMILLTDGDNTENRRTGNQGEIDARARLACAAAKQQGITIYAVRVIEGNRSLLQECASGPGFYYEVSNASQLAPVFQAIAGQIGSIRLTQ